jgi:hypothetical protein
MPDSVSTYVAQVSAGYIHAERTTGFSLAAQADEARTANMLEFVKHYSTRLTREEHDAAFKQIGERLNLL